MPPILGSVAFAPLLTLSDPVCCNAQCNLTVPGVIRCPVASAIELNHIGTERISAFH